MITACAECAECLQSGSLNLLEPSGPVHASTVTGQENGTVVE